MSYRYRPLQYDDEIRLVEIRPDPYCSGAIHCEIIHRRRSDPSLKYEALSYTWGGISKSKRIVINTSCEFSVTPNCYDALRRVRHLEGTRLIWIDAICINQEDNKERTRHVRAMGDIYEGASQVLVYLGEADADSKRLFEHISEVCGRNDGELYGSYDDKSFRVPALVKTARAVLQRPWFSRIWVLQEVFHGMGNVIVVCGPDSTFWDVFASCCINLCASGADGFDYYSPRLPYALNIGTDNSIRSLYDLLCETRHANATDDRDKFFAILSMVDDKDVATLASYDQSTVMVYTAIGLYLLRNVKLVLLLSVRHCHSRYPALASWIPDWSYTDDNDPFWISNPIPPIDDPKEYNPELHVLGCCRRNSAESDHLFHPVLSVSGFRAGFITSLGATFDFESYSATCLEVIKRVWESKGHTNDTGYLPPGFTVECKCCDIKVSQSFADRFAKGYNEKEFRNLWCRRHGSGGNTCFNFEFVEGAMRNCRLFLDENNHLGLAPREAAVGDAICVIEGACDPCILRERPQGDWFLVSGECYFEWEPDEPNKEIFAIW